MATEATLHPNSINIILIIQLSYFVCQYIRHIFFKHLTLVVSRYLNGRTED